MSESLNYLCSSIVSSFVTKTCIAPLERLKNLQQSERYYSRLNNTYNSTILNSFRYIYKTEGFQGFFKGNLINIYSRIPSYAMKFPLNDLSQNYLKSKKKENLTFPEKLLVGTLVGSVQIPVSYPFDVIKTRIYLDKSMSSINNSKVISYTKNMIKLEGFRSLYKGFLGTCLTYPLYVGLQMSIFYEMQDREQNIFVSGATAGLIAQTSMYPGDTLKKHLQLNGIHNTKNNYKGIVDCLVKLYKKNGISVFYTGLKTNIIKSLPGATIQFTVYEYMKKLLS